MMTRVVERCATCGVEHEVRVDECEACGGALRYWCRSHSRELGWLETPECHGCVEEKARPKAPRPAPARPPAKPVRTTPVVGAVAPSRTPARTAPPRRRAARVPTYAPPPAGTPLADILETREWEDEHTPSPLVITALQIWIPCIILFALGGLYRAVVSRGDIGELLARGAFGGWMVGLLLVIVFTIARLARHP